MEIKSPTQEQIEFYSQFPSYKLQRVRGSLGTLKLVVQAREVITKLDLSSLQERYLNYLERAKNKGCAMELKYSEFIEMLSNPCTYCGEISYSIDRKDSSGCYTKDNIQPICVDCNMMKYTHSEEKFLSHVAKIYLFNRNFT